MGNVASSQGGLGEVFIFLGLWCWLSIVFLPCVNGSALLDMYIDTCDSFPVILIYFDLLML